MKEDEIVKKLQEVIEEAFIEYLEIYGVDGISNVDWFSIKNQQD